MTEIVHSSTGKHRDRRGRGSATHRNESRFPPHVCTKCGVEPRVNGQRWGQRCHNEQMRLWRHRTGRNRVRVADMSPEDREKLRARHRVAMRVRRGQMMKPDRCALCKTVGPVQQHHPDYRRPLDVVWVCALCHTEIHR
jgi:hypothetical protein